MFDCASWYKNEAVIGKAIHEVVNIEKKVKRSDLFIVSKLWWDDAH